ncbi:MAG: alcohol dehydrogenase catalytic domain-containing protein [Gammaproteobacteria bacterium]|nr:alcohol dehydrogenase catalytic domain-containing protein [Gammaproteobacteria bacterium]
MPANKQVDFFTFEYQKNQTFKKVRYTYIGNEHTGWVIFREGQRHLNLGPGYRLLPSLYCGLCATDLARHHLPFPLPQITGHEVVADDNGQAVCVEINASHQARGQNSDCFYCNNNLSTHCPERLTLGIDRLPGGFAPYILAPINGIHSLPPKLDAKTGTLIEPFAAALHAVTMTPPQKRDQVAVLGPKKLGMLIISALSNWRQMNDIDFTITAVIRTPELSSKAKQLGADKVTLLNTINPKKSPYDLVYDTTGSPQGFETALRLCRRELHLKSTHGQTVQNIDHLTTLVINEMSLQKWSHDQKTSIPSDSQIYSRDNVSTQDENFYDVAIISHTREINSLFNSKVNFKPGASIFIDNKQSQTDSLLEHKLSAGLKVSTSRCGSFHQATQLISRSSDIAEHFTELITHDLPLSQIEKAFEIALTNKKALKLVIKTEEALFNN